MSTQSMDVSPLKKRKPLGVGLALAPCRPVHSKTARSERRPARELDRYGYARSDVKRPVELRRDVRRNGPQQRFARGAHEGFVL